MGRKTKFNDAVVEILCKAHENGASLKTSAKFAGLDRKTVRNWLNQGKEQKRGKKRDFYLKWQEADAKYQLYHLKNIKDHAKSDWRASKYLLEVNDPEQYVVEKKYKSQQENNIKLDNVESVADAITRSLQASKREE